MTPEIKQRIHAFRNALVLAAEGKQTWHRLIRVTRVDHLSNNNKDRM